jgi:pimeloyl-ACP methyl ester carboxylesterase
MRALAAVLLWVPACVLLDANRSNKTFDKLVTVKGALKGTVAAGKPAFVVLFRSAPEGWQRQASRVLYGPGSFEFLTVPGRVQVFAFVDENLSSAFDPSEPSAALENAEAVTGQPLELGALTPIAAGPAPVLPIDLKAQGVSEELVKVHRGDEAKLDEERFSAEAGKLGFWSPVDFALKYGVGVSFMEPYDAKRIPVLFVHGAEGSPVNFEKLIGQLDRTKYQAWVYSYPSGARLDLLATTLKRIADDLQLKLGFQKLAVVAHSMGGLVARAFVALAAERGYVKLLVTLSTPFNGHESAQKGVDRSPVVVPCWFDMAAGSPFLVALRKPLAVPHHLFFSYIGGSTSDGPTDGTVSMRSMLQPEIEQASARVLGFAETHDSILTSAAVFEALNASLAQVQ